MSFGKSRIFIRIKLLSFMNHPIPFLYWAEVLLLHFIGRFHKSFSMDGRLSKD